MLASETETITSEGQPTKQEITEKTVIPGEGSAVAEEASAVEDKEVTYQGDDKVTDDPKTWYEPGKYRTRDDAIRNADKRMGGIAQQLSALNKKLEEKAAPATAEVNSETGEPYTQDEIKEQWNEWFREDPVAAQRAWNKMMADENAKEIESRLANKIVGQLTWSGFLANNPDMNTQENIEQIQAVLRAYPLLESKPNALLAAKDIVKASGESLEDKYANWIVSRKKGKENSSPRVAPQIPGQGGTNKGGPSLSKDPFFGTKDGGVIFDKR